MKKVLILLLALSMVFTFAACREKPDDPTPSGTNPPTNAPTDAPTDAPSDTPSDAPSDVPSDAPVVTPPEPTPDEKVAAIKNEVLKLLSDDEKDTRKSPAALLESLEKDFAIKNIVRTAGGNTNLPFPTSIVQKDGSSVKVFEDETYYTFTHKDIVMYIMQATGEEPDLYHCERSEEYYSSLFYAFGLDLSLLFGSVGELPDDEEVEIDFPLLTADDLTVSEDFTTCTISEAYLKKLLGSALKSYNYTDADIEALFLNFEGSGVYTVAEKKLVFNLSAETEKTGPVTLYIMVQDHPTEGLSMQMATTLSVDSAGIKVPTEISFAINNLKYNGDTPISGNAEMKIGASFEQSVMGQKMVITTVSGLTATINVEDPTAPAFTIVDYENSEATLNGVEIPDYCYSYKTETSYDPTKTEKRFVYRQTNDDIVALEAFADEILFGDAVEEIVIPDEILAVAEKNYEDCKKDLEL